MASSSHAIGWVPQHHRDITLGRLDSHLSPESHFSPDTLSSHLWLQKTHTVTPCVTIEVHSVPKGDPNPTFDQAVRFPYSPACIGQSFGPSWTTHWFRLTLTIPTDWTTLDCPLMLAWDSGSEAMVWTEDGEPQQGLTDHRNEYGISPAGEWTPGQTWTLFVEMAANGMFGLSDGIRPPDENRFFTLKDCSLGLPNLPLRQLYYDLLALQDIAKTLPPDSAAGMDALYIANKAINNLVLSDPSSWDEAKSVTRSYLGSYRVSARDAQDQDQEEGARHQVYAIGHCHIDTAWLWPFSETRRKTARSWSSQLRIMERFPEHAFAASSAQQYEWLMEDYPGLFKRIQGAAGVFDASPDADARAIGGVLGGADGSLGVNKGFIPVGGSWVEMDANLPSGESIVRQFLYGQRFFKRYFKKTSEVFWLPDTFGYCAQLPQIMSKAGFKYFLTQKLSWNNINTFPHNTFYWRALDGQSQVLTHFPPANTYCSQVVVEDVVNTIKGNRDKDRASAGSMLLFGFGDGGGGPTMEMMEKLRRIASSSSPPSYSSATSTSSATTRAIREGGGAHGSLPRVGVVGPEPFFKSLESSSSDLLSWQGELYFELHRGTYTTHAANKAFNRRCELLLREVEMLGTLATLSSSASPPPSGLIPPSSEYYKFPKDVIDEVWKDVLLFQFHDVIPGSAIGTVYETSLKRYLEIVPLLQEMRHQALRALALSITGSGRGSKEGGDLSLSLVEIIGASALPFTPTPSPQPPPSSSYPPIPPPPTLPQPLPQPHSLSQSHISSFAFNPHSFPVTQLIEVEASMLPPSTQYLLQGGEVHDDNKLMQYASGGAGGGKVLMVARNYPPMSLTHLSHHKANQMVESMSPQGEGKSQRVVISSTTSPEGRLTSVTLTNDYLTLTLDSYGRITSLLDKSASAASGGSSRELIPLVTRGEGGGGKSPLVGNDFKIHEDIPTFWDAWDLETSHLEKCRGIDGYSQQCDQDGPQIIEDGPLRASVLFKLPISPTSSIQLTVSLTSIDKRVDFELTVDWNESRRVLKVEFPLALSSDHASYETQFGAVERPTHQNTSWDWAKFEVVAHRWADLSEPDYGLALLNDSKYGHAVRSLPPPPSAPHLNGPSSPPCSVMTLTLLRSPKCPDPTADIGRHCIKYALLPHVGRWQEGGVVQAAHAFNQPLTLINLPTPIPTQPSLGSIPTQPSLGSIFQVHPAYARQHGASSTRPPLLIDTIKLSEDQEVGVVVVVRLYEPYGCRGRARVGWDEAVVGGAKSVMRCNLLEEEVDRDEGLEVIQGSFVFDFTPFTIYSFKFRF